MTLIFNASPVIVLAKAGLLAKFSALGSPSLIPQAVVDEVCNTSDPMDPARVYLEGDSHLLEHVDTSPISPILAGWNLGSGESAVISTANSRPGSAAVLDDLAARRCAQAHGIPVTGTLGLVLLAKKRGLIAKAGTALEAIVHAGLYVSDRTMEEVRAKAGE